MPVAIRFSNCDGSSITGSEKDSSTNQTPAKICPFTNTRIGFSPIASSTEAYRSVISKQVPRCCSIMVSHNLTLCPTASKLEGGFAYVIFFSCIAAYAAAAIFLIRLESSH